MRASRIVSGFASWRWTPCCALIAGSLLYVALVVLVVPNSLGKLPSNVSTPAGQRALTSDALGTSATHPLHRGRTPATQPPPPDAVGLGHAPGAAAAPPRHLTESRASALGSPAMTPRPSPPEPPPAPPPPPPEPPPEPAPAPPEPAPAQNEPAPPAQPHAAVRSFIGGMHMIAPHLAPTVAAHGDQPPGDGNSSDNGGSNADGQQ